MLKIYKIKIIQKYGTFGKWILNIKTMKKNLYTHISNKI